MSLPEPIPPSGAEREANRLIKSITTRNSSYKAMEDGSCMSPSQSKQYRSFVEVKRKLLGVMASLSKSQSKDEKISLINQINEYESELAKSGKEELINLEVGNKIHRMKVFRFKS